MYRIKDDINEIKYKLPFDIQIIITPLDKKKILDKW